MFGRVNFCLQTSLNCKGFKCKTLSYKSENTLNPKIGTKIQAIMKHTVQYGSLSVGGLFFAYVSIFLLQTGT